MGLISKQFELAKDRLRYNLIKLLMPKQQFYIQNNKFHSVFHPIFRPLLEGSIEADESSKNNNK